MDIINLTKPKHRRLRISIRVLLIAVLVAGVWMGNFVNKARRQSEAVAAIERFGGWVDYQQPNGSSKLVARWIQRVTGDDYFDVVETVYLPHDIREVTGNSDDLFVQLENLAALKSLYLRHTCETSDEGLGHIQKLKRLQYLEIGNAHGITDAGTAHLAKLKNLRSLEVSESKMTDEGLARLGTLSKLGILELSSKSFTEVGLRHLAGLPRLQNLSIHTGHPLTAVGMGYLRSIESLVCLDISRNPVTVEGLMQLKGMKNLKWICVIESGLSEEAIKRFKEAMPNVWVENGPTRLPRTE